MQGLKVEHWHQWEKLCCFMMSDLVHRNTGEIVGYRSYGSQGQNQYGVDLVPIDSQLLVVGQCKLKGNTSFTWDMLTHELKKTDEYSNDIECFVLFTTANRHTSIQDMENGSPGGRIFHTRKNGKTFPVLLKYWSDVTNMDFIPQNVLRDIFPGAFQISIPPVDPKPSADSYLSSQANLRRLVPAWITRADLQWLETWDFTAGYVKQDDIGPFEELFFEHDRTSKTLRNRAYEDLSKGYRAQIASCLPAGERFFAALIEFRQAINAIGQGKNLADGTDVMSLSGLGPGASKFARDWMCRAEHLAQIYHQDILGCRSDT
jgi:hypothetical protein